MTRAFPKAFFVTGTDTGVGKTIISAILAHGLSAHYWKPIQSGGVQLGVNSTERTLSPKFAIRDVPRASSPHSVGESCDASSASSTHSIGEYCENNSNHVISSLGALASSRHLTPATTESSSTDCKTLISLDIPSSRIVPERFALTQPLSPHLAARIDGISIKLSDFSLPNTSQMNHLIIEGAGGLLVPLNEEGDKVIDLITHLNIPVILVARSSLGTINHTLLSLAALQARSICVFGVVMVGPNNKENRKAIEQFGNVEVIAEVPELHEFSSQTLLKCFSECFNGGAPEHGNENSKPDLAPVHANAHGRSAS